MPYLIFSVFCVLKDKTGPQYAAPRGMTTRLEFDGWSEDPTSRKCLKSTGQNACLSTDEFLFLVGRPSVRRPAGNILLVKPGVKIPDEVVTATPIRSWSNRCDGIKNFLSSILSALLFLRRDISHGLIPIVKCIL